MDIHRIRQDFPLLKDNDKKAVIYLDNACQSLRPQVVLDVMNRYYSEMSACSGRSMHHLAARVTQQVDESRQTLAKFLGADRKEEIIFTRNTTEGINLVANSLQLSEGDVVVLTDKEHNSNLIPWQMLTKRKKVILRFAKSTPDNRFDPDSFASVMDEKVKLVSVGATSNLDGVSLPVNDIIQKSHKLGALVMLDAAQMAPHQKIQVKQWNVDFLALSGHKMLGPSGTGVLFGKYALLDKMEPFLVGGDTVASSTYETCEFLPPPEKFEAGLQDYAGIMGLAAAAKYLMGIGFEGIQKQEQHLNRIITDAILDMPGLVLIGPQDPALRGGVVTFYLQGIDSHRVALMLDQMAGITVRSGQHCVHSWFHARQIKGSIRASAYFYNTVAEAETLIDNLKKIRKVL